MTATEKPAETVTRAFFKLYTNGVASHDYIPGCVFQAFDIIADRSRWGDAGELPFMPAEHPGVRAALVGWLATCSQYMERQPGDNQLNTTFKRDGYAFALAILGEAS